MKMIGLLCEVVLLCVLAGCGGGGGRNAAVRYVISEIPAANGSSAYVNNAGQILTGHILIEPNGATKDMSLFTPPVSTVTAVSNSGYFVGKSNNSPCVWSISGAGQYFDYNGNPEYTYQPNAVNDAGITVGYIGNGVSERPARSDITGHISLLTLPNGYDHGAASDINNQGIVVGVVASSPDHVRAAVWDQTGKVKMIGPADGQCVAMRINNTGEIAGITYTQALVWDSQGNILRQISPPSKFSGIDLMDMNDKGELLGTLQGIDDVAAVIWTTSGTMVTLDHYHDGHSPLAQSLNNTGVITGILAYPDKNSTTVFWTPN